MTLDQIPLDIVASVIVVLCSLLGVAFGLYKTAWPIFVKLHNMLDDWNGEPERPGVPKRPGVMERLGTLTCDIEAAKKAAQSADYNSKPNSGHSAYDRLMRRVDEVSGLIEESQTDRRNIWNEITSLKRGHNE